MRDIRNSSSESVLLEPSASQPRHKAEDPCTLSFSAAFPEYPMSTKTCRNEGSNNNVFAMHRRASLEVVGELVSKACFTRVVTPYSGRSEMYLPPSMA